MKPYQEKLLKLAGFEPGYSPSPISVDIKGYIHKSTQHFWDNEELRHCFNSLDWLEQWIMPVVREEYVVVIEEYNLIPPPTMHIATMDNEFEGQGKTKVEALNNALEELVNEAKPDK